MDVREITLAPDRSITQVVVHEPTGQRYAVIEVIPAHTHSHYRVPELIVIQNLKTREVLTRTQTDFKYFLLES